MRKIIFVRRTRSDTFMFFVVKDSDRRQFETWRVGPGDEGSKMEGPTLETTVPYNDRNEKTSLLAARTDATSRADTYATPTPA